MSKKADVELRLPADGAYASVLRTTTAGLAARLDFTIDDIEDARMLVGEANAMVLEVADEGADLTARFRLGAGEMTIEVGVTATAPGEPDYDSFAWQVIDTLAASAEVTSGAGRFAVVMTLRSSLADDGTAPEDA